MKKRYTKPDIEFESFSLSTSIAGNCEIKTMIPSNEKCGYPMDGLGTVFLVGMNGCTDLQITDEQSAAYNGFCYHVPTENNNLFNS